MIKVNTLQRGNPVLNILNKVSWHFDSSISADFEINYSIGILFLTIKFYSCKPEYIYKRINKLKEYKLKILLLKIDSKNFNKTLLEILKMIDLTVILCKDNDECSRYLKGFNLVLNSSINILKNNQKTAESFLSSFPKINKNEITRIKHKYKNIKDFIENNKNDNAISYYKSNLFDEYFNKDFYNW